MAIFRSTPIVGAISGNLAGQNFMINRHGPIVRKRLIRVNKTTPSQLAKRNRFANTVRAWRNITTLQNLAWVQSASLISRPNRLGINRPLDGFTFFMRYNLSHVDDPTIQENPPSILTATPATLGIGGNFIAGLFLYIVTELPPSTQDYDVYIYAARGPSKAPVRTHTNFKFLLRATVPEDEHFIDIEPEFNAIFGTPILGEKIAIKTKTHLPDRLFSVFDYGGGTVT